MTQKMCMCVNRAIRTSAATISNCSLCVLCAIRSGSVCRRRKRVPTASTATTRERPSPSSGRRCEPGSAMKAGRCVWPAAGCTSGHILV